MLVRNALGHEIACKLESIPDEKCYLTQHQPGLVFYIVRFDLDLRCVTVESTQTHGITYPTVYHPRGVSHTPGLHMRDVPLTL